MKRSKEKFGNVKQACISGHSHRSQLESATCAYITALEQSGEYKLLQCEDHIDLTPSPFKITYIADFKVLNLETNEEEWFEAKGFETPTWAIKLKLWRLFGPGKLTVVKGTALRLRIDEVVPAGKYEITPKVLPYP